MSKNLGVPTKASKQRSSTGSVSSRSDNSVSAPSKSSNVPVVSVNSLDQPRGSTSSQGSNKPSAIPSKASTMAELSREASKPSAIPSQVNRSPTSSISEKPSMGSKPSAIPSKASTMAELSREASKPSAVPSQTNRSPASSISEKPSMGSKPSAIPSKASTMAELSREASKPSAIPSKVSTAAELSREASKPSAIPSQVNRSPASSISEKPSMGSKPSAIPSKASTMAELSREASKPSAMPSQTNRSPASSISERLSVPSKASAIPYKTSTMTELFHDASKPSALPSQVSNVSENMRIASKPSTIPSQANRSPTSSLSEKPSAIPSKVSTMVEPSREASKPSAIPSKVSTMVEPSREASKPSAIPSQVSSVSGNMRAASKPSSIPSQVSSVSGNMRAASKPSSIPSQASSSSDKMRGASKPSTIPSQGSRLSDKMRGTSKPSALPSQTSSISDKMFSAPQPSGIPSHVPSASERAYDPSRGSSTFEMYNDTSSSVLNLSPRTSRSSASGLQSFAPSKVESSSTSIDKRSIAQIYGQCDTKLQEGEVLACTKDAKERLLMVNDQLRECMDKQFNKINQAAKEEDKYGPKETIVLIKVLIGRLQLGIYDSHLMIELCHYLQSYTSAIGKCKEQARRLLVENGKIRDQIEVLGNEAYDKESQLASTHEMLGYWEFMAETSSSDVAVDENTLTRHDLWRDVYEYDDRDLRDVLYDLHPSERILFQDVRRMMSTNNNHDAIRVMKTYLKSNNCRKNEAVAHILIVMANYCHDAEMYEDALDALINARLIFTAIYGASSKEVARLTCRMANIHVSDQAWSHAASLLRNGITEYLVDNENDQSVFLCRLYFNLGYFLFKMNETGRGFRLMELAVIGLSKLLPNHDSDWAWCCFLLAKLLNNSQYYAAACFLTCETFDYFLENNRDMNAKIFELALAQDEFDIVCRVEDIPAGGFIAPIYQEILGEMKMSFCGMARIAACDLIDHYLDEVKRFDEQSEFTEEEFQKEKKRLMDDKQRKTRESYFTKTGPTMQKSDFKISQNLVNLLHRNNNPACPLEYKTVENRGKSCKHPLKNLQMMLKQEITVDAPIKRMKEEPKKGKERERSSSSRKK